jgi:Na+:H+ antiporter
VELGITSVLALFTLLGVSAGVFYAAKAIGVPYTVLLVAVGLLLVPFTRLPGMAATFGFLDDLQLTPELLFLIFLPILIFESGYEMSVRALLDNAWTITLLAVVGLLIAAFGVAGLMWVVLSAAGTAVPFVVLLLFGSIISATDPVAVLALFKDFGAPRRLSIVFEGESLFNDGTAVALFFVVLGVANEGFGGPSTVLFGAASFVVMMALGILVGLVGAGLFTLVVRRTRSNDFVAATLLMISAHLVFISCELFNEHHPTIGGLDVRVSSIIATTVSSLFLGNYARHALSPTTDAYVDKVVGHLAFVANSLVFLLAGLLFASTDVPLRELWLAMVLAVLIVAGMRAVSVLAVTGGINLVGIGGRIPRSWQWLLAWGSLRGALAIIVVLLIPDTFTVVGWTLDSTPRDFLLALTISCILVTLFIKAPLIGPLMRRLRLDDPEPVDVARRNQLGVYYLLAEREGFSDDEARAVLRTGHAQEAVTRIDHQVADLLQERDRLVAEHGPELFDRSVRLVAIRVEERALGQLYVNGELGELTYRRLHGKLQLQAEHIQAGDIDAMDEHTSRDRKDVFDALVAWLITRLSRHHPDRARADVVESTRAQLIMARRVVRVLGSMQGDGEPPVFHPESLAGVLALYQEYDASCTAGLSALVSQRTDDVTGTVGRLTELSRNAWGMRAIASLSAHGVSDESDAEWLAETFAE